MFNIPPEIFRKVFNRAPFGALCVIAIAGLAAHGTLTIPVILGIGFLYTISIMGEISLCYLDCAEKIRTNGNGHD